MDSNTWVTDRIQVFITKCLHRMVSVHWPDRIINQELLKKTNQEPVLSQLWRRQWNWLGQSAKKLTTAIWNKYSSGHHRAIEEECSQRTLGGESWKKSVDSRPQVELEENRGGSTRQTGWRGVICCLCSTDRTVMTASCIHYVEVFIGLLQKNSTCYLLPAPTKWRWCDRSVVLTFRLSYCKQDNLRTRKRTSTKLLASSDPLEAIKFWWWSGSACGFWIIFFISLPLWNWGFLDIC